MGKNISSKRAFYILFAFFNISIIIEITFIVFKESNEPQFFFDVNNDRLLVNEIYDSGYARRYSLLFKTNAFICR